LLLADSSGFVVIIQQSPTLRGPWPGRLQLEGASNHGFVDRIGQPSTDTLMSLDRVPAGRNVPDDFNVIIEIPAHADPIKYEVDKETGAVFVDRFIGTAMHYPCNYGYVPKSLADDGDPLDVLVITPFPLQPGVVVRCRPLGVLKMEDEAGGDSKLLAVPVDKILPWYRHWQQWSDIAPERLAQIQHFFEHYKDLEKGKWVKVIGWEGPDSARKDILDAIAAYKAASPQPAF
jgi:inorganic pyrophosphatase